MSSSEYNADFRMLGLAPTENWLKVKSAYRKLALKWHPDRYTDSVTEKKKAEEKLKDINLAYNRLSNYYKKHSRLPPKIREIKTKTPENRKKHKTQEENKSYTKPYPEPEPGRAEKYSRQPDINDQSWKVRNIIFVIIAISFFLLLLDNDKEITLQTNKISGDAETIPKESFSEIPSPPPVIRYFTYGSTLGKVHSVQGVPTKIEGDIWYYGKSEVKFEKGRVVGWIIDPDTPLNASATKIDNRILFGYGSTVNDVLRAQGRPSLIAQNLWEYGLSKVYFENGVVIKWYSSPSDPLNIIE